MSNVNTRLRTLRRTRAIFSFPVKAAEVIHKNDLIIWDAANNRAVAGAVLNGLKCAGVAMQDVTGGVADGDATVDVEQGEFVLLNVSGGNTITNAHVFAGATAYIEAVDTIGSSAAGKTAAGPLIGWQNSNPIVRIEY